MIDARELTCVAIVSEDAMMCLASAVDPALRPHRMILLQEPQFAHHARHLATLLREMGVETEVIPTQSPGSMRQAMQDIAALLDGREHESLALNVTAGNRLLSLAAFETFRNRQWPVFILDPLCDRLSWVHDSSLPPHGLEDRISLRDFLYAYGHAVQSTGHGRQTPSTALAETITRNVDAYSLPLRTLNWLAGQAGHALVSPSLTHAQLHDRPLLHLIELFAQAGAVQRDQDRLAFPDEDCRFYVSGGWFEQFVFGEVQKAKGHLPIQDAACNVVVLSDDGVKNELDVLFLASNRLHMIECKAKRFMHYGHDDNRGEGAQAIYKLEALKHLGGDLTRMMLASCLPVPEHDRIRAAERGILVLSGDDLRHFAERVEEWVIANLQACSL